MLITVFNKIGNINELFPFIGWVIAGVLAVVGYFNIKTKDRQKESDGLADTLIKRLQQTVDSQTEDLKRMQVELDTRTNQRDQEIVTLQHDLSHLQGRNGLLEELFKGRDPSMDTFFKKDGPQILSMTQANTASIEILVQSINNLIHTLTPLLPLLGSKKV